MLLIVKKLLTYIIYEKDKVKTPFDPRLHYFCRKAICMLKFVAFVCGRGWCGEGMFDDTSIVQYWPVNHNPPTHPASKNLSAYNTLFFPDMEYSSPHLKLTRRRSPCLVLQADPRGSHKGRSSKK